MKNLTTLIAGCAAALAVSLPAGAGEHPVSYHPVAAPVYAQPLVAAPIYGYPAYGVPGYYGAPYATMPFMDPGFGGMMPGMAGMPGAMASAMTPGFGAPFLGGYPYGYPLAPWGVPMAPIAPIAPAVDADTVEIDETTAPLTEAPTDADQDGVFDIVDLCPSTKQETQVDALGCAAESTIVLEGVHFHTDSAMLTDESTVILDRVAATLSANTAVKVEVAGHTDSDADDAYNAKLSQMRANVVMSYLAEKGVPGVNMSAKGYGEAAPMVPNDSAEHKAMNRRVELRRI